MDEHTHHSNRIWSYGQILFDAPHPRGLYFRRLVIIFKRGSCFFDKTKLPCSQEKKGKNNRVPRLFESLVQSWTKGGRLLHGQYRAWWMPQDHYFPTIFRAPRSFGWQHPLVLLSLNSTKLYYHFTWGHCISSRFYFASIWNYKMM